LVQVIKRKKEEKKQSNSRIEKEKEKNFQIFFEHSEQYQ